MQKKDQSINELGKNLNKIEAALASSKKSEITKITELQKLKS